jgi:hypothetical protein
LKERKQGQKLIFFNLFKII